MRRFLQLGGALVACGTLVLSGCTAPSSSSVTVSGKTLTIYLSAPAGSDEPQLTGDVLDAEQLAYQQLHSAVSGFTVQLRTLTASKASDNARTAIQDTSAIAYLGEAVPPSSANSLGITNSQDLLQVSPTDTALELTQYTPAVPGSPNIYYESLSTYGRTFARLVPTTAYEAKAQVQQMGALGLKRLYVTNDGGAYGKTIATAVTTDAASAGISAQPSPAGADAAFMGASSDSTAAAQLNALVASNPRIKLFVPSALDNPGFTSALSPAAQRAVQISAPGFLPASLTPVGKQFVRKFVSTYHHQPALQAVFGYEAMAAVIAVLQEAGSSASNRSVVVSDFLKLNRDASHSAIGAYTINSQGDISIAPSAPYVFSRVKGSQAVPVKQVQ